MSAGQLIMKILRGVLMFFGALFLILIIGVIYFVWADPLDLRQYFSAFKNPVFTQQNINVKSSTQELKNNPLLTDDQENALRQIGVDPASLPTEITPEMEKCFEETLGKARVLEIVVGDTPSPLELLKAKNCL